MLNYDFKKVSEKTQTLWSGESRIEKHYGKNVLVSRDKYLDRNGNPVFRASIVNKDGSIGKVYRTNGGQINAIRGALDYNDRQRN